MPPSEAASNLSLADMQAEWEQIQHDEQEAYKLLPHRPEQAYHLLSNVRARTQALYAVYGNGLPLPANDADAFQLNGLGMCALMLGRLSEAQERTEQALALLSPDHSARPNLLRALADVYFQQARFGEAARQYQLASEAAASQARQAYELYVRQYWVSAIQSQVMTGTSAYFQGDRDRFLRCLDEAAAMAQAQQLDALERQVLLLRLQHRLYTDPTGESLDAAKQEFARRADLQGDPGFQVDLLLLEIDYRMQRGTFVTLESKFEEAYWLAQGLPNKDWAVLMAWAGLYPAQAQSRLKPGETTPRDAEAQTRQQQAYHKAVERAEQALQVARASGIAMMILPTLQTLIPLRLKTGDAAQRAQAEREQEELRASGSASDLTAALLALTQVAYEAQQYEQALQHSLEAEQMATQRDHRRLAFAAQSAIFQALGRKPEALAATLNALNLFQEQVAPNVTASVTEWQALLNMVETLHNAVAVLKAEEGDLRAAFAWAEEGKAQRLRRLLAQVGHAPPAGEDPSTPIPPEASSPAAQTTDESRELRPSVSLESLQAMLRSEGAGMALFCVGTRRTLLLVLDPQRPEPQAAFLDLSENDLASALKTSVSAEAARSALFDLLSWLSPRIMPHLEEVARHSKVLYIVPHTHLYAVPFAALTFADGTPLMAHCAPVLTPSAAILQWCRAQRPPSAAPTCLSLGVGEEQGIAFADMAEKIAALFPAGLSRFLPDATVDQFLEAAKAFRVLHLCCHGDLNSQMQGTLSSSALKLRDGDLTARALFDLPPWPQTELVFLNACVSGTFRLWARGEIGGFWQAFLHSGVPSLIATYVAVHPDLAQQVAERFYTHWLRGMSKAEALQTAQLEMHRQGLPPHEWATHFLVGDAR